MEYMLDDSVMVMSEETQKEIKDIMRNHMMKVCQITDNIADDELEFKYGCYIIANKKYKGDLEDLPSSMKKCIDYVKEHPEEFGKS